MIKRHKNSLGKRLMGFAGVSVATLGIGFQANAGEKTWDFETDPFDEFPYIASSQEDFVWGGQGGRSEEHTSELHHTVISYAVFCLKKKTKKNKKNTKKKTKNKINIDT